MLPQARMAVSTMNGGSTALGAVVPASHHGLRVVHGSQALAGTPKHAMDMARSVPIQSRSIQAVTNPKVIEKRGVIGTLMRPVEVADKGFSALTMMMMPAFLLMVPGGAMGWLGKRFGSARMERWGHALKVPMGKMMGGTEGVTPWLVEDVGHVVSGSTKRAANLVERVGLDGVAGSMRTTATRLAPMEAKAVQNVASATHSATAHVGKFVGALERRSTGALRAVEEAVPGMKMGSLRNMESKISNSMKGTGKLTAANGLWRYGTVASTAVSTYNTSRNLHSDLRALRQVYAGMLGKRPDEVSNFRLFFGRAPELISGERHMLIARYGLNVIGIALGFKLGWNIHGGSGMMTAIVAQMGISSLTPKLAKNSILPAWNTLNEAHMLGATLTAQNYAPLVAKLASRGGMVLDEDNPNVMAIAAQYAQENLSAKQVLDEAKTGKMSQRRRELEGKHIHEKPVAGVAKIHEARAKKAVVGEHTGSVVSQAATATRSNDAPAPAGGRG